MQPDLETLLREARAATPKATPEARSRGITQLLAQTERAARRRRVPLIGGIALAAILVLALAALGAERALQDQAATPSARVVDRTLLCSTRVQGGLRMIEMMATPAVPTRREPLGPVPSSVDMTSGGAETGTWVSLQTDRYPDTSPWTGQARYSRQECRVVNARVPLTTTGLAGGRALFQEKQKCEAPRQVLVRIRATFERPTRWVAVSPRLMAARGGRIIQGAIAVRTQNGRPLAFATATRTSVQLYAARHCWR
jgi:hypothetical protein